MISFSFDQIQTVLCIGAHADDIEIGCGGTMLKLLSEKSDVDVRWLVLSGDETRAAEARASAEGFLKNAASKTVDVADFGDGHFPYTHAAEIKKHLGDLARSCQPDLIFSHRRDDAHQDHRLVADLTWQHFRNHLILEYEIPKYEGDLGAPGVFVPLADEICHAKAEMLLAGFPSQSNKPWFRAETFLSLMRIRGIECQSPTGLAESFYCRKLRMG